MERTKIFEPEQEIDHICDWVKDYWVKNTKNYTKAIIGMSGGKDSFITAALLVRALGADKVVGVLMPQDYQEDIEDAQDQCEYLGIQWYCVDIGPAARSLYREFEETTDMVLNNRIKTNTPARLRMTTLYMTAAALGGRVVNTCNLSEDYVGYSTKYGDLAGDFGLLEVYCVREVLAIGKALGLPEHWIYKTPADGMCGHSDEESLGVTYKVIDEYILDNITPSLDELSIINTLNKNNKHKNDIHIPSPHPKTRHWNDREYHPGGWCVEF